MVAVLVILGVAGLVAVSRFTDPAAEEIAASNTLKAHLRYAQLRAMGDTVPWSIVIGRSSYTLQRAGAAPPAPLPGESGPGKDVEVELSPSTTITFSSARGVPLDGEGEPLASDLTIYAGSQSITIAAGTGFIP